MFVQADYTFLESRQCPHCGGVIWKQFFFRQLGLQPTLICHEKRSFAKTLFKEFESNGFAFYYRRMSF